MNQEHAKISTDGTSILEYKKLDSDLVLDKATAIANGKPYWLPVVRETQDASTGDNKVQTRNPPAIEASRVYVLTEIRDKTAQELDDDLTSAATKRALSDYGQAVKMAIAAGFANRNEIRSQHGQAAISVDVYLTQLDAFASQLPDEKFIAKMKEIINAQG